MQEGTENPAKLDQPRIRYLGTCVASQVCDVVVLKVSRRTQGIRKARKDPAYNILTQTPTAQTLPSAPATSSRPCDRASLARLPKLPELLYTKP